VATLFALLVVVAIVVIIWLAVRPGKLHLSVDHATVRGFNFTSGNAGLAGTFVLALRAYNPNKRSVVYRSLDVGVWFDGTYLGGAEVPGFRQPPHNETRIDVAAPAVRGALPRGVEGEIKKDRSGGRLPLDVHVQSKVWFKYGIVRTRSYKMRASCPLVPVDFASPSSFDRVYCHVHI
jgi:LEA14-like dessication related protein